MTPPDAALRPDRTETPRSTGSRHRTDNHGHAASHGTATASGREAARNRRTRQAPTRAQPSRALELLRFGAVGGAAFVVDVGTFNLLLVTVLVDNPIPAKVVSVSLATLVAWLGNRYWTFASRRRDNAPGELATFVAANAVGLLISAACLAVSRHVLGLTSTLADNVAANGIGLVLGMAFRYVAYRYVVFTGRGTAATTPAPHPSPTGRTHRGPDA